MSHKKASYLGIIQVVWENKGGNKQEKKYDVPEKGVESRKGGISVSESIPIQISVIEKMNMDVVFRQFQVSMRLFRFFQVWMSFFQVDTSYGVFFQG